jgi:hypothetical protein
MDPAWREYLDGLERFNAWEAREAASLAHAYRDALAWMAEAWKLAAARNPDWLSAAEAEAQVLHLRELAGNLDRVGLRP